MQCCVQVQDRVTRAFLRQRALLHRNRCSYFTCIVNHEAISTTLCHPIAWLSELVAMTTIIIMETSLPVLYIPGVLNRGLRDEWFKTPTLCTKNPISLKY